MDNVQKPNSPLALCFGGNGFDFGLREQIILINFFVIFFNPSRQMPGYYLESFNPNPFQSLIR
jgi:hypothetical protein